MTMMDKDGIRGMDAFSSLVNVSRGNSMAKADAYKSGKGRMINGLWYFQGTYHQVCKGAVPVKAVKIEKLKGEQAFAVNTLSAATATVAILGKPEGTSHERREWVKRFTNAHRLQAR